MKIGDRVIYDRKNKFNLSISGTSGIIVDMMKGNILIHLDSDFHKTWWCLPSDIEIDKEWYREEKLKELGL